MSRRKIKLPKSNHFPCRSCGKMFHPRRLRALRGTDDKGNQMLYHPLCLDCYKATDEGPERKMRDEELETPSEDSGVSSK